MKKKFLKRGAQNEQDGDTNRFQRIIHKFRIFSLVLFLALLIFRDVCTSGSTNMKSLCISLSKATPTFQYEVETKNLSMSLAATTKLERANHTLVTAFFPTPTRRHSLAEYFTLMERLFSCHDAMVIFTSPEMVANLTALRAKYDTAGSRTRVIGMDLNETHLAQQYKHIPDFWSQPRPNKNALNAHYTTLWVWNEKMEFLKRVAVDNPFRSNFFAWVDAGLVRWDEYANTTLIQRIPPELQRDQMMVLNVTRITARRRNVMMGAGLFGGYREGILRYNERYYDTQQKETDLSLSLIEQKMMYKTCVENPGMCLVIRPEQRAQDKYGPGVKYGMFYMLSFLNQNYYELMKRDGLVQNYFGNYTAER